MKHSASLSGRVCNKCARTFAPFLEIPLKTFTGQKIHSIKNSSSSISILKYDRRVLEVRFFLYMSTVKELSITPPLSCRTNQKAPLSGERVLQNHGVCWQAFPSLPAPSPLTQFLLAPCHCSLRSRQDGHRSLRSRLCGQNIPQRKRLLRRLVSSPMI